MRDLGYFGHFLHLHAGGRSGKQHMLERILREGGTVSQRELQDTVPISSAAVSEVLAKLESEGLITRTRSESDKRQLDVTFTENGQARPRYAPRSAQSSRQRRSRCSPRTRRASS
jgi:DNA-binding MarR family transcriptional regulator